LRAVRDTAVFAIEHDVQVAQSAAELRILILTARRYEKDAFINLDVPARLEGYTKKWQANRDELSRALAAALALPLLEADRQALQQLAAALPLYVQGFEGVRRMIDAGTIGTAEDANREFEKFKQSVHDMETASVDVNARAVAAARRVVGPIDSRYAGTRGVQLALAAACFAAAGLLSWLLARSIKAQLGGEPRDVAALLRRVADGDLATPVDRAGAAPGSLMEAVAVMQSRLAQMVAAIRAGSDSIATGADQIAGGSSDLSQRTEMQASSLQ